MPGKVLLPSTLEEFRDQRREHPAARIYHGGTDVLVQLNRGSLDPPVLICIERIQELKSLEVRGDNLYLGAGLTHSEILADQRVATHWPLLSRAVSRLGSAPIRRAGTLGGNLGTASPAGDTLPALYCLGAQVHLDSARGVRVLDLEEFITGPGDTALASGELILGVQAPKADNWCIQHYEKVGRRTGMACSIASLAALIQFTASGIIEAARFAWGSVGPTVIHSPAIDRLAVGHPLNLQTLERIAQAVRQVVSPIDDQRASAEYRRCLAGNLALRLADYSKMKQTPEKS